MNNDNDGLPFVCKKEITPYDPTITVTVSATVYEAEGNEPVDVILSDQDWYVIVEWELEGKLVDHLCGYFCPRLHIECYGLATEGTFRPYSNPAEGYNLGVTEDGMVKMDPCKEDHGRYQVRIDVKKDAIRPEENGDDCGTMCCLGLTLQSRDLCNKPGHINIVCEGPCIGFFDVSHAEEPEGEGNG